MTSVHLALNPKPDPLETGALDGSLHVSVDHDTRTLGPGAVIHVPAESLLRVDTSAEGGSAWVTTTHGLTATLCDGTTITPPWAV